MACDLLSRSRKLNKRGKRGEGVLEGAAFSVIHGMHYLLVIRKRVILLDFKLFLVFVQFDTQKIKYD